MIINLFQRYIFIIHTTSNFFKEANKLGGTKIFVFQMKHICKVALIGGIVLAVLILVAVVMMSRNGGTPPTTDPFPTHQAPQLPQPSAPSGMALYNPGTYYSEIVLAGSSVFVVVEVSATEILSITLQELGEAQEVFYPLIQPAMSQLSQHIIYTQSLDLEASSETPYTQEVLIQAIRNALDAASVRQ